MKKITFEIPDIYVIDKSCDIDKARETPREKKFSEKLKKKGELG